jgi:hypothetical protein
VKIYAKEHQSCESREQVTKQVYATCLPGFSFGIIVVLLFSTRSIIDYVCYSQLQQPRPDNYSKESYANSSLGRRRIIAMVQKKFHSVIRS